MTNRRKLYITLIATPIAFLLLVLAVAMSLYDLSILASNPKQFVTSNFPALYYNVKKIALNAGGENIKAGEMLGVPQIKLDLSRSDKAHFSNLMNKFNDPQYGVSYYSKHNKWRKAKIDFEGKKYNVKVKAHGRNPSDHQEADFLSLSIKMPEGERIMGANRFSLIVRSRIYTNRLLILQLAKGLDIIHLSDDLVRVKINGQREKYFFFEKKFDNNFMEAEGLSSFRRIEYSASPMETADKSLVKATDRDPYTEEELVRYLKLGLLDDGIPESHFDPIISRYLAINKAITSRSMDVNDFFNPDYIAKYDALTMIMGFVGHAWMRSNFFVYYNQADGLFYPGITRDSVPSKLLMRNQEPLEKKLNSSHHVLSGSKFTFPLIATLSKNDQHRQLKYHKIAEMLSAYPRVKEEQQALRNKMRTIHSYGWAESVLQKVEQFSTDLLPHNLSTLRTYLSQSTPYIQMNGQRGKLTLIVEPKSMSAIGISKLVIKGLKTHGLESRPVSVSSRIMSHEEEVHFPIRTATTPLMKEDVLDLTAQIQNVQMYSGIDNYSDRVSRKYIISIEMDGIDFSEISLGDINLEVRNLVMKMTVPESSISLKIMDDQNLQNLHSSLDFNLQEPHQPEITYSDLQAQFPKVVMSHTNDNRLTIHAGQYDLKQDFIVPRPLKLIIEAGTTLRLGEKIALMGYKGIDIDGTKTEPVVITAIDPLKPYGTVGILGTEKTTSHINYLYQSYGSERWVEGVFFSGGLSIHYNNSITIKNSHIKNNQADDGANFKYVPNVLIEDTVFQDNYADQIDLDYTNAHIFKAQFQNTKGGDLNGDGLDISGSKVIVFETSFTGFRDKGISIGENSEILVNNSSLKENFLGAAVKDRSTAYFLNVDFSSNKTDIAAYMKKRIFGGGKVIIETPPLIDGSLSFNFDEKSTLSYYTGSGMLGSIESFGNLANVPQVFENLEYGVIQGAKIEATYQSENYE